ncbi:hypothetical protein [Profundibacter sp.]
MALASGWISDGVNRSDGSARTIQAAKNKGRSALLDADVNRAVQGTRCYHMDKQNMVGDRQAPVATAINANGGSADIAAVQDVV